MVPVFGHFVSGSSFLVPRSWALRLLLDGRFMPWSSFLGPGSWALCSLLDGRFVPWSSFLVPGHCACYLTGALFLGPGS
jgi:hypothetical protein